MAVQLFTHNQTAYHAALSMLSECGKTAVIHPTGTGKSFIGFLLAQTHPKARVCWLSPSEYIYRTQCENWIEAGGTPLPNVLFHTYAKLMLMSQDEIASIKPDYVVLDEFHRCGAEQWGSGVQRLLTQFPETPVLGLSATNIRYLDNQRNMAEELFDGNIASQMSLGDAIVRGILNPPVYVTTAYIYQDELVRLQQRVDSTKNRAVQDAANKYLEKLRRALDHAEGLESVFSKYLKDSAGKYLVFCANRKHMTQMIEKMKVWVEAVDKEPHIYQIYADNSQADEVYASFKQDNSDHLKLLFCIDMLNEGVHIDDVSGVVLLRPTVSPIIYKQQIGRALSAKKNTHPVIIDVVNNFENLYSIGTIQEEMEIAVSYYRDSGQEDLIVTEAFQIVDKVKECRLLFEQLEKTLDASWGLMYSYAKNYYAERGDLSVPKRYKTPEGYSLGSWIQTQRRVRNGRAVGTLSEKQIAQLDEIGMIWESPRDLNWERNLNEAKAYYHAHGDLDVGARYVTESGFRLGAWINQLRFYKNNGAQQGYLTKARIEELDKIGMIWSAVDHLWVQYYNAAVEYHKKNGNIDIPIDYVSDDGVKLGRWINRMRGIRAGTIEGRPLTASQIQLLDDLGMIWNTKQDIKWEKGYQEARNYFEKYGNLNVPSEYVSASGFKLGRWLINHREGNIKVTAERRRKLDGLGMVWEKQDPWQVRFELAKQYYEEQGNLDIPTKYTVEHIWLGKWVSEQRKIFSGKVDGKSLSRRQIELLDSISMNWTRKGQNAEQFH